MLEFEVICSFVAEGNGSLSGSHPHLEFLCF
jgi:hypothetical protein